MKNHTGHHKIFRVLYRTTNEGKGTPGFELGYVLASYLVIGGPFNHLPNYAPIRFGSIKECLWIKPLADKNINEVDY